MSWTQFHTSIQIQYIVYKYNETQRNNLSCGLFQFSRQRWYIFKNNVTLLFILVALNNISHEPENGHGGLNVSKCFLDRRDYSYNDVEILTNELFNFFKILKGSNFNSESRMLDSKPQEYFYRQMKKTSLQDDCIQFRAERIHQLVNQQKIYLQQF